MARKEIKVRVAWPTTEEGWAQLREGMARANTIIVTGALNKIDAPAAVKRAYLESLNGRVPWATNG